MKPDYWDEAAHTLARRDRVLARLIRRYPGIHLTRRSDPFTTLARAIVGQQISVKAADSIWRRFVAQVDNAPTQTFPCLNAARVATTDLLALRQCGLSARKAEFLTDLAGHFNSGRLDPRAWTALDDEALIEALVDVKGIGRWTAEMFLMFHELRPDILPVDDIGVQKAIARNFNGGEWLPKEALFAVADLWRPWRTVATWYPWRSLRSHSGRVLMADSAPAPYAGLTPDLVLDALGSCGWNGDGRLLALNSYENRVYQVWLEESASTPMAGSAVVAKFYRPGRWTDAQILEEHAFVAQLSELEIPVVASLRVADGGTLAAFGGFRFSVYPKHGGRAPELEDRSVLTWIGRFIGRIHAVGDVTPFQHRPAIDIASFGEEPRDFLLEHDFVPADLLPAWTSSVAQALDGVRRCYDRAGDVRALRLHGDCHAGNILWTGNGPHFVDFDDCRTGPAVQDLWMLLSGERAEMQLQMRAVLQGYEDFCDFDDRPLHLIEALRTLRLIHYSAWLARRWDDPAFPAAFPWFNTQRYWQDRVLELREQIAAMDEPALVV